MKVQNNRRRRDWRDSFGGDSLSLRLVHYGEIVMSSSSRTLVLVGSRDGSMTVWRRVDRSVPGSGSMFDNDDSVSPGVDVKLE